MSGLRVSIDPPIARLAKEAGARDEVLDVGVESSEDSRKPSSFERQRRSNEGYVIHKMGRQVGGQVVRIAGELSEMAGRYRIHTVEMHNPERADVYAGRKGMLFRNDNLAGRASRRAMLPKEYSGENLIPSRLDELRRSGAAKIRYGAHARQGMNAIRLATDVMALADCAGGECDWTEYGSVISDMGTLVFAFPSVHLRGQAMALLNGGGEQAANPLLVRSTQLGIFTGAFRGVSGAARIIIEVEHYAATGDANGSAIIYGTVDAMLGLTQVLYSVNMLQETSRVGTVASRNSILAAKTLELAPNVMFVSKISGGAAAGIGIVMNGYMLVDSALSDELDHAQRRKNIISSSMGVVGSGVWLVSALIVAPTFGTASSAIWILGALILIAQSIYDHYDEIDVFVNGNSPGAEMHCKDIKGCAENVIIMQDRSQQYGGILLAPLPLYSYRDVYLEEEAVASQGQGDPAFPFPFSVCR